ncbi:LuxR family transcriptional regulator [Meinhardsimonia xiamenensis]|jgi:LuxR family transcriptional regulator|uniref:LuxR family transcriptional regulator n=1 Tax=Meinhardsimonia xiamenensis TaxID=990712 RepID=A0A1G9FQB9_9RHOB|nr:LuxR family transcriptional regulator [Meinhardsimonia xiamenensis]PRX37735.1 LuxR family transcriptional regulator [Meinhardsimonia xiamenensis]SDK90590.1 LuxR family transcriptional regulator [Meinhardsimonia xiamenensis]
MLEQLERIIHATEIEGIWRRHCQLMEQYGFDRLFFGMTKARTAEGLGAPEDFLILSSHEDSYARRYIGDGLYLRAPMARWAMSNVGACSWSWVERNAHLLTPEEREVLAFNRAHGVRAGYTLSFPDLSSRCKGVMALAAPPHVSQAEVDMIWRRHGRRLWVLNNVLYLKLYHMPYPCNRRKLSHRQREVLEWVGEGKTLQDIAQIMGIGVATVEKHLRLAREKLGVQTTAQALLKASFENQIFVIEGQRRPAGLNISLR